MVFLVLLLNCRSRVIYEGRRIDGASLDYQELRLWKPQVKPSGPLQAMKHGYGYKTWTRLCKHVIFKKKLDMYRLNTYINKYLYKYKIPSLHKDITFAHQRETNRMKKMKMVDCALFLTSIITFIVSSLSFR